MKTKLPDPSTGVASAKFHQRPLLRGVFLAVALCAAQIHSARAQSPSPYTAHTVPSSLQTQVTNLTNAATTAQQQRRAATLQWALTQATYLFTNTIETRTSNPGNPIDRTASVYPGDTTTRQAPAGVTSGTTYDLRYSPLGLGDGLVADVSANIASNTQIGNPNTTGFPFGSSGYNLCPTMPNFPNPTGSVKNGLSTAAGDEAAGYFSDNLGTSYIYDDSEVALAEVFTHPDYANYPTSGGVYGNPKLINVVMNSIEYYAEQGCRDVAPDIKQSVDGSFQNSINYNLPYLLVSSRFPDLILPSMKTWWLASIYRMLKLDYGYDVSSSDPMSSGTQTPGKFLGNYTDGIYPNNDFRRMEGMFYASIIFQNNASYPNVTTNVRNAIYHFIGLINSPSILYGDGAFTYAYHANPLQEYQDTAVTPLSNVFVVLKGSTVAADQTARTTLGSMLQETWLFYPIQWNYAGDREDDALVPSWKVGGFQDTDYELHGMLPSLNPELACGSYPQVWRVFDENGLLHAGDFGTLSAAAFDQTKDPFGDGTDPAAAAAAAAVYDPNDYYGYDQNFAGPTSRFGLWREFGSARPESVDSRGPSSVIGFYLNSTTSGVDSAALSQCGCTAYVLDANKVSQDEITKTNTDGRDSTIVTPTFASVVTQASLNSTTFNDIQEWILTPNHMVGLSTVNVPASGATGIAIGARIQLRNSAGVANTATNPRYLYGNDGSGGYRLVCNVANNTFGYSASDTNGVRLYDTSDVANASSHSYPAGDRGHYTVDIHPANFTDSPRVTSVNTSGYPGLYGLEFADGADRYMLIHNTTSSAVSFTASLPSGNWGTGSVLLHHAEIPAVYGSATVPDRPEVVGETYRPAWMNTNDRSSLSSVVPTPVAISGGAATFSVPAYSHVVLTKIVGIVDGGIYELEPRSAPGSRVDIAGSGTANGTLVDLYHRNGYTNQQWLADSQGGGVFRFISANTPAYLDVLNDGTANGTQVVIATDGSTPGKMWTPVVQTDGAIEFTPGCAPGSVLESYAHNTNDGNKIEIWQDGHYTNQQFNVMRMNPVLDVGAIPPQ